MHRVRQLALAAVLVFAALVFVSSAAADSDRGGGAVYTLTNAATGNAVAVFERAADGSLAPEGTVSTGGLGTGSGLGSQGALVLDGHRLFAVNAGSNTISSLRVEDDDVELTDVASSGGVRPISLTVHGHLLYVLNAGNATTPANIVGVVVWHGELIPLPGSSRPLSTASPDPAQIEFTPDGRVLVVTEKATNRITTYRVAFGYASAPFAQPSAGQTPFGFAFDGRGHVIVSEAFGGAPNASVLSSYEVSRDGAVSAIDPNVATTETAACWVVVTKNGRFTYTTNTGSNSISGYAVSPGRDLTLLDADGRTAATGATPIDAALSRNSRFLYELSAGAREIGAFAVGSDGSLEPIGTVGGLPAGSVGLAA